MPSFEVTSPDGVKYRVEAPDGATEQDAIAYIQNNGQSSQPEQGPSPLTTLARQGYQGLTANFGDEAIDFVGALGASALSPDLDFSEAYKEARGMSKSELQSDIQTNPGTSLLANIGGGLISGGGIAQGAKAVAPQAVSKLAALAATNPYATSAAIGLGGGAISGFGTGDSIQERTSNAAVAGIGGAVAGPAINYGLRNFLGPIAERGGQVVSRLAGRDLVPESAVIPAVSRPDGDLFTKTVGERTQDAASQILEADALAGRYGQEASSAVRNSRVIQNEERKAFVDSLSPKATSPDELNDVLDSVYTRIANNAETLDKQVGNAYNLARQGNSVKINASDVQTGLLGEIGRIRNEVGANLSDKINYSKSNAVLKALSKKLKGSEDSTVTAVNLGDLEDWRKTLTGYANDAQGTEKAFLGKVRSAYDDFMTKTASEAVDLGDAEAITAFRDAVGLRRKYGDLFQKNKIVESIATGKTVDDFAKDLIGSGSIAGKKNMLDNAKALVRAGGEEGDLVKSDLSDAFAKRIYTKSLDGLVEGQPETGFISPAKLATQLDDLFVKNKTLGKYLYGQDGVTNARKAIKELKLISTKQPATQNPSGSGQMITRVLRDTGITRIPGLSLINNVLESQAAVSGQAATDRALAEFTIKSINPKSNLFSGTSGIISGPVVNSLATISNTDTGN